MELYASSLHSGDACKIMMFRNYQGNVKHEMFKRCHFGRFKLFPFFLRDTQPIALLEKNRKYFIGYNNSATINGATIIGPGWSDIEPWGVWSDSRRADIRFFSTQRVNYLILDVQPFIYRKVKKQRIMIYRNGMLIYSDELVSPKSLKIPITGEFDPDEVLRIMLVFPDATSPLSTGHSSDARRLGVGLISMELI
jgi:hypothetical protein